jgi:hypothetical protein
MNENGKHEYYEDVSMEVKPTGCEGWGKKYYTCVKCGDTYTKYYTLGHRNIVESATLVKADGTCTDGVVVTKTCGVCNKVILNKTYYYHYDVEERVDISEYVPDTCTEQPKYVYVSHCACGEYGSGGIEYDDGSVSYGDSYTFVCRDKCGLVIEIICNKAHDKDVHCKVNYTYVFNVYKDNTCVEAITLKTYGREHETIRYGTLNGVTCADGATIIWKCVICGRVTNTYNDNYDYDFDYHYNFVAAEYDLSKIGKDGEKLYVLADPCGNEDFTISWFAYNVLIYDKEGNELELTYETEVEDADGNLIYEGMYKCPTTDPEACGLVVGFMVERDSNSCSATLKVILNCDDDWNGGTVIIENIALGKWHVLEDNGRYLTESDITDSSYVYTVCSYRYIEECVNKDYEEYEDDYKHNISEDIIDAATCTQYGFKHKVCDRCGEDLGYDVIPPRGHSWNKLTDNLYECSVCGLQSSTGSDGYVVLEDATNKFAGKDDVNSDDYVVGYWMLECAYYAGYYGSYDYDAFDYTEYYTAKISLIYTNSEGKDVCLVDTEGVITVTDLKQYGNYVKFSTTEVAEWAAENKITNYTIRISFVPVGSETNYDYAITFTA